MKTTTEEWYDCYKKGWKGVITDDSFRHPAKFGYGLIQRMIKHAIDLRVLQRGGLVVDPFGGVGCGGIVCAYNHIRWVGCELETPFYDMSIDNFKLHQDKWMHTGCPLPLMLNGDSRNLLNLLNSAEIADASNWHPVDMIISSPPEGTLIVGGESKYQQIDPERLKESLRRKRKGLPGINLRDNSKDRTNAFGGRTVGNMGRLASQSNIKAPTYVGCKFKHPCADAVVSSPPFEGVVAFQDKSFRNKQGKMFNKTQTIDGTYGSGSLQQLGNHKGHVFWTAAQEIVRQCYEILKPEGICIWVCKDYVKDRQRIPFSDNWQRLCEANGFKLRCRHKAMLKKQWKTGVLFGNDTKKKERKSFFRKLIERKGGPEINWEDIICMEKV